MAKVYKDLKVTWTWDGDKYDLRGFNVAIVPQGGDPKNDAVVIQRTGKDIFEHSFRNILLNDVETYIAWVQAIYPNEDSNWFSESNLTVSDDGTATIETTNGASNKASNAEKNAKAYTDDLETSLGNLAFDNLVEKAKLGSTIIDGGYIKSDLLTADNILTGRLGANRVQIGGGTTYESGYDPTTKETPDGAQKKADGAEDSAKSYTDTIDIGNTNLFPKSEVSVYGTERWSASVPTTVDSTTTYQGNDTLELKPTSDGAGIISDPITIEGNQTYTWSFMIKASYSFSPDSNKVLHIQVIDDSGDLHRETNTKYYPATVPANEWTKIWVTFDAPKDANNLTFVWKGYIWYLDAGETYHVTNFQLEEGSKATAWSPMPKEMSVGTITIDGRGIKTTGANGNYSLLTDDQLAFYEAGSSTPHWYSKNVAYGTAQDGDYIELNWDKPPKVQTAIKSLMSYNSEHSASNQMYKSYPSSVSENGFYVSGKSTIVDAIFGLSGHSYTSGEYSSTSTINNTQTYQSPLSVSSVTNISCDINFSVSSIYTKWDYYSIAGYFSGYAKIKYKNNDGVTTTYDTLVFNRNISRDDIGYVTKTLINTNVTIDNLPEDRYYLIVELSITMSPNGDNPDGTFKCKVSNSVSNVTTKSDTIVDNGEVMWIAVEGGAD